MSGIERIAAERKRQIEKEGWTPEHDDEHGNGELAEAAACYILTNVSKMVHGLRAQRLLPGLWPWSFKWWKPSGGIRDLEKAGALIAAEIDRLERAKREGAGNE